MPELITTLFLAPSGAGKSSTISTLKTQLRDKGLKFTHIDCDKITEELSGTGPCAISIENVNAGRKKAVQLLAEALARGDDHIIVDSTPTKQNEGGLIFWALRLSQESGRTSYLNGFSASPLNTHHRTLERDGGNTGADPHDIMNDEYFRAWLYTYQEMPDEFLRAAAKVDRATLHDNNGKESRVIAGWAAGKRTIHDEAAYAEFLKLRDINPEAASFEAVITGAEMRDDRLLHTYKSEIFNLYGPNAPTNCSHPVVPRPAGAGCGSG